MNPMQLLEHFDRITEVPGSVSDLRALIIHLGVTGKLVQHEDEGLSGDAFYLKIQEGIARLAAGCNRCRWGASNRIALKDAPFSIPDHWTWARINDTGLYINGIAFKPTDWKNEGLPIIRIQNLSDETKEFNYVEGSFADENKIRYGDLLVSWSATLDAFLWHRADGVLNQHIFKVIVNEDAVARNYLYWLLKHEIKSLADSDHAHGLAMKHINRGPFLAHAIPIPPLAEQHRIVAKIDELMVLCDQLQTAQSEREAKRDLLVAASLHRIGTEPIAENEAVTEAQSATPLRNTARFHLDHLPRLTTRPGHIKQLRQTILNLAVRGRLVPQDPNDESASQLLASVAVKKAKMCAAETGRDWVSDIATSVLEAFVVPKGWAWTRIANTAERVTVGYVGPMKDQYVDGGIPFLRSQNVRANRFREEGLITISPEFHQTIAKSALAPGDVVVVRSGNVGTACVIPPTLQEANCSDLVVIKKPTAVMPTYLCFYLNSLAAVHIQAGSVGVALTHFNTKSVATMPLPLPPLAEQYRIVAKVDELMSLCDQLETQLTTTQTDSRRLLEAVLHEALAAAA